MSEPQSEQPEPSESVLDVVQRKTGHAPSISLSDVGSDGAGSPVSLDPRMGVELSPRSRGNYQVLGEIARGGMGAVLRGHDADLRRDVAIKVLDEKLAGRPEVVQRFVEEAQIGAQLQHPGVVPVYELGLMADERPFFTMKLVKGRTLASLLSARKSPETDLRRFLSIFEAVCQTVAYAHSKGVLHRDLKPANVMVGAFGEVQVVDWGLAKVLGQGGLADEVRAQRDQHSVIETVRSGPGSSGSDSLVGSVLGTPAYMAPEQARGDVDALDERTDVFALGALLCEVLTGAAPYRDDGESSLVVQAARAMLGPARARLEACGADEALRQLALDCMAPAPQARPASAEAVARAVQEHLAGAEERARAAQLEAAEARVRVGEERKRRRLAVALGGAVAALLIALGVGSLWAQGQAEARREGVRRQLDGLQAEALELQAEARHDEAVAKAREARALATDEGLGEADGSRLDAFVARVEGTADEAREREAQAARNARLLESLNAARLMRSQVGYSATFEDADGAFAQAFAEYGLDVEDEDLVATLETLRQRGMGEDLALVLDEWASLRRWHYGWTSVEAEALTSLAADLDPDPLRTNVRGAVLTRDTAELLRLQDALDVAEVPPATSWVLASAIFDMGEDPTGLVRRAIHAFPGDVRFRILLGAYLSVNGASEEARRSFEAALALSPDHVYAIDQLAELAQDSGVHATAVRLWQDLDERMGPSNRRSRSIAFSQLMLGRFQEAVQAYERAAALGPLEMEDEVELAAGRYFIDELTADEFWQATEGLSTNLYRVAIRAWALSEHPEPERRDLVRALASAQQAVALRPGDWLPWYAQALAQHRLERYDDLLETLAQLEPIQEQRRDIAFSSAALYAIAHHHLEHAQEARRWLDLAEFLFELAAGDDPDGWEASNKLGHLREARALVD